MRQDARMLAALFERSMGLGEAWEVLGTWSGEVGGAPDELRAGVARRRGHAVPCPDDGPTPTPAVPRTGCPEHGAGTVPVPWVYSLT